MPTVHVIGGPNGAGKTTLAFRLIPRLTHGVEFVNADLIAQGLSAFEPEKVALTAGRILLKRLDELAASRADFAFESTLAARSFAPMLTKLKTSGYRIVIFFVWVRTPETSVQRVAARVQRGGHHVPPEDVRRRHARSWSNALGSACLWPTNGGSFTTEPEAPSSWRNGSRLIIRWCVTQLRGNSSSTVLLRTTHHEPTNYALLRDRLRFA